ncbi:MAG TPA: 3-oxoacyl-ACP reductase, partial [Methylophilaceae bacterium]|nr:3-oxoacyl-ACP reductase [Methylophilaceae bacterium]
MTELATNKKIALVTGASRGIGAGIAVEMARQGFIVIGTATTNDGAKIITQMFELNKLDGIGYVLDVNSNESINDLITKINTEIGEINVLVNNAG